MDAPLDLDRLFRVVLPATPRGPATQALLAHMANTIARDPGPMPDPVTLTHWEAQAAAGLEARQKDNAGGPPEQQAWKRLCEALLERWPPWSVYANRPSWGPAMLARAAQCLDEQAFSRALDAPHAPRGALTTLPLPWVPAPKARRADPRTAEPARPVLGWLLDAAARHPTAHPAPRMLARLLEQGVDPNEPCGPGGEFALSLAHRQDLVRILLGHGARLGAGVLVPNWFGPEDTPARASARLSAWSAGLSQVGPGSALASDLRARLPEITGQVGRFLDRQSGTAGLLDVVRQFRALARQLGVDPVRPAPADPSLVGEWCRAQLCAVANAVGSRDAPRALAPRRHPLELLPRNMVGPNPLSGATLDGVGPQAWAYLAHLAFAATSKSPPPPHDQYGLQGPGGWPHVDQALGHIRAASPYDPHTPLVWMLLKGLHAPMLAEGQDQAWRRLAWHAVAAVLDSQAEALAPPPDSPPTRAGQSLTPWPSPHTRRAWTELVGRLLVDFRAAPAAHPATAVRDLLRAQALEGWSRPAQAMELAQQLHDADRPSVCAAQDWPLSRAMASKDTPVLAQLRLALSLPNADPEAPTRAPRM